MRKVTEGTLSDDQIQAILDRFVRQDLRLDEAEREIARLKRAKDRVIPRLLKMIASADEELRLAAGLLLPHIGDQRVIEPLRQLIADPRLDDDTKLDAFGVLREMGAPVDERAFFASLHDPHQAMRRSTLRMIEKFDDEATLASFLEIMREQMPVEMQVALIENMADLGERRALKLFRALLHAEEDEVVLAAIDALDKLKDPAGISPLEELAEHSPTREIRQEARKVAAHLTMRASVKEIKEVEREQIPQFPLYDALITTIDGDGGQIVFVVRQRPDGRLKMLDVMFNDHQGIKDCIGVEMIEVDEFEEMLEEFADSGILAVEASLARCRQAVEDAYRLTLEVGRRVPMEYFAWKDLLQGDDPRQLDEPELEEIDIDAQPELFEECDQLLDLVEFEYWFFNPHELKGFDRASRSLQKKRGRAYQRELNELIRQGVEAIVDDDRRRLIRDRLRRQAWLLHGLYEDEEVWQWAMAAAAGLEDDAKVPVGEHPLLLGMMVKSLENATGRPIR